MEDIGKQICLFAELPLCRVETRADEDQLISIFFQRFFSDVLAELLVVEQLHSQFLDHLDLPQHVFVVGPVCWDLAGHQASGIIFLLEDVKVIVAQSAQEGRAGERGRASTNQRYFCLGNSLIKRLEVGVSDLFDFHLFENLACKFLQFADLNGPALQPIGIACGCAKFAYWTQPSTGQTERVIAENGLRSSIVILVLDLVDERPDVYSNRAGFLARAICALHASGGLGDGLALGVNAVVEVPSPVVLEIRLGDALEFDLMLLPVFLSGLGVDHLRLVEMRSRGEDSGCDLGRELGKAEAVNRPCNYLRKHG